MSPETFEKFVNYIKQEHDIMHEIEPILQRKHDMVDSWKEDQATLLLNEPEPTEEQWRILDQMEMDFINSHPAIQRYDDGEDFETNRYNFN